MRNISPLRYPGGKAKLAGFIALLLRTNHLCNAQYVEPYAGGASVALGLLLSDYVSHVHVNDLDRSIYAFWHSALNKTEELCRRIRTAKLSVAEWRRQRTIQKHAKEVGLLDLGYSTLYLNRTNRSGIICSAGVIGGLRQRGKWKLDARFYRETLVRRIQNVAEYRDRITLSNLDATTFLRLLLPTLPAKSLLYLDPPYYAKGKRRLYANSYEYSDHAQIATLLRGCRHPWLVTYDDVPQVRALYSEYRRRPYHLQYTASNRYKGAELMLFSHGLAVPSRGGMP